MLLTRAALEVVVTGCEKRYLSGRRFSSGSAKAHPNVGKVWGETLEGETFPPQLSASKYNTIAAFLQELNDHLVALNLT